MVVALLISERLVQRLRVFLTSSVRFSSSGFMDKRTSPKWVQPQPKIKAKLPPLKLFNSLSNNKDEFIPINGTNVTWYCCGPTVYDSAHMGHARSYISFDILRRVISDYFGFKINYVMNITDIDDKIIKKARQNYLVGKYFKEASSITKVKEDIRNSIKLLETKSKTHPEPDQRAYLKSEVDRIRRLLTARTSLTGFLTGAQDALADYLDSQYGSTISDHKIFEKLPRKIEEEFLSDMRALNVLEPTKLTRVSEYIEPIIRFIQKIIDNKFAYVVESGSVYFDTKRFADTEGHFYAKLMPSAYGDADKLASGEGDLSMGSEKRTFSDFALWKASKPGEPAWPSPWGKGRPGWHIECSAMASDTLGDTIDIHTGGVDLKFPHHDNELAQSEAYFGHSHWVNYFLHAGHLTISGCKMSKSLKNFVTIRKALEKHSSRQLRFAFLLHSWRDTLDYSADTMSQALAFDKTVTDFLFNVSHAVRLMSNENAANGPLPAADDISKAILNAEKEIYDALCDSVDTRRAMAVLRELIGTFNQADCTYPLAASSPHLIPKVHQAYCLAAFILRLLRIFGAADRTAVSQVWPSDPLHLTNGGAPPVSIHDLKERSVKPIWISMEAPTFTRLALTLCGALESCKVLSDEVRAAANNRKVHGVLEILDSFEKTIADDWGLHIQNLPSAHECLTVALKRSVKDSALLERLISPSANHETLEEHAWPVVARALYLVADLRQSLRVYAQSPVAKSVEIHAPVLTACDRFRDDLLPAHGIRLQDRMTISGGASTVEVPAIGIVDASLLAAEKRDKAEKEAERGALKAQQAQAKEEAARMPPSEMFRSQTDKYSAFDEKGIPTHDASGKEVSKSQLKKLQKQYDIQAKRYEAYLANKKSDY
uniref:cysteine--tRNA ligase n=2 Tax=Schistocephalus solidus TaxID=70667 RepID=A0A0V0J4L5_SCHSO